MYLTTDIGNTRIKYQFWNPDGTPAEGGTKAELWELEPLVMQAEAVAISNVGATVLPDWPDYNGRILFPSGLQKLPYKMAYKTPQTLGADRIAAVAGAMRLYPGENVLCIDAGTCITFDLLSADGVYQGGAISPGIQMRYQALNHYTGKLPLIRHQIFDAPAGQSTEESILAGVQQGIIGEIHWQIAQANAKYPGIRVVITGGDASFLAERMKTRIFAEPLLIHHGLLHCLLTT